MIKYNLICECEKIFESWFSSSVEYDVLKRKKLINCIYCNSTSVKKTIMAPNLSSKSNQTSKRTKFEKNIKKLRRKVRLRKRGKNRWLQHQHIAHIDN